MVGSVLKLTQGQADQGGHHVVRAMLDTLKLPGAGEDKK